MQQTANIQQTVPGAPEVQQQNLFRTKIMGGNIAGYSEKKALYWRIWVWPFLQKRLGGNVCESVYVYMCETYNFAMLLFLYVLFLGVEGEFV